MLFRVHTDDKYGQRLLGPCRGAVCQHGDNSLAFGRVLQTMALGAVGLLPIDVNEHEGVRGPVTEQGGGGGCRPWVLHISVPVERLRFRLCRVERGCRSGRRVLWGLGRWGSGRAARPGRGAVSGQSCSVNRQGEIVLRVGSKKMRRRRVWRTRAHGFGRQRGALPSIRRELPVEIGGRCGARAHPAVPIGKQLFRPVNPFRELTMGALRG